MSPVWLLKDLALRPLLTRRKSFPSIGKLEFVISEIESGICMSKCHKSSLPVSCLWGEGAEVACSETWVLPPLISWAVLFTYYPHVDLLLSLSDGEGQTRTAVPNPSDCLRFLSQGLKNKKTRPLESNHTFGILESVDLDKIPIGFLTLPMIPTFIFHTAARAIF